MRIPPWVALAAAAATALLLCTPAPAEAQLCEECHILEIPLPDGGSFIDAACFPALQSDGWYTCIELGFSCLIYDYCFPWPWPFAEPEPQGAAQHAAGQRCRPGVPPPAAEVAVVYSS